MTATLVHKGEGPTTGPRLHTEDEKMEPTKTPCEKIVCYDRYGKPLLCELPAGHGPGCVETSFDA